MISQKCWYGVLEINSLHKWSEFSLQTFMLPRDSNLTDEELLVRAQGTDVKLEYVAAACTTKMQNYLIHEMHGFYIESYGNILWFAQTENIVLFVRATEPMVIFVSAISTF